MPDYKTDLRVPGYNPLYRDVTEPQGGDPYDSRWGGPVAWDDRVAAWAQLGQDEPERPFGEVGKVDLAKGLPTAPVTPLARQGEPSVMGPPQPGIFEGLSRGLTGLVTQFIPNEGFQQTSGDIAGFVGSLPDKMLDILPVMEFLPGGADVGDAFGALPEDALKLQYEARINADPINAHKYMSEYLNRRGSEVSEYMGISGVMAPMFTPSLTFSEQLRRIIFGGLTGFGDSVARTYAGNEGALFSRNAMRDIIDVENPDDLNPELQDMRQRFLDGRITQDQFYDELAISGFRWTNDDSIPSRLMSFGMDVLTDPFTWTSFGIGGAGKAMTTGAVRFGVSRVFNAVDKAGRLDEAVADIARRTGRRADEVGRTDIADEVAQWAKENAPDLHEQGLSELSGRQRALYSMEPVIRPAAAIANKIDNPFSWLSPIPNSISRVMGNNVTTQHMRGFVDAHGVNNVLQLQAAFTRVAGDKGQQAFNRYLAIAAENQNVALHQRNIAKDIQALDPDTMNAATSKDVVDARRTVNSALRHEGEEMAQRTKLDVIDDADVSELDTQATRANVIDRLVAPLSEMTGMTDEAALAFLKTADRDLLSLVHNLNYGKTIDDFVVDRQKTVDRLMDALAKETDTAKQRDLQNQIDYVKNMTLISDHLLTRDRAVTLLKALRGDDAAMKELGVTSPEAAAKLAVQLYDQLDANFAPGRMTDDVLVERMKTHLHSLLEQQKKKGGDRLTVRLTDEELANASPELRHLLGKQDDGMYSVGLAPKDRWGLTRAPSGRVVGVNSFVDVVTDTVQTPVTRAFGNRDRVRATLLDGIRGARMHYQARAKFMQTGVKVYGMSKREAYDLFDTIRQASMEQQVGTRGFSAEQINSFIKDVNLPDEVRVKLGERGIMEMIVRSWEGELTTVGLSSKMSGKMKSAFAVRTNNLVGRISENLYPLARFGMSPMFLAMELTEGPFFAILRGIKPGMKWTADDIRMNSILQHWRSMHPYTDQLERAQLAGIDTRAAKQIVGERGFLVRAWNKIMPERFRAARLAGKRPGLYEYKELLYIRQFGNDAALEMKENAMRYHPEMWARWEAELGTTDPTKVFMAIMEDRGAFDPGARHNLHMFDAAKPSIGKKEPIRLIDVAEFMGFTTAKELQEAVRAGAETGTGGLTEDAFISKYTDLGLQKEYAERAYFQAKSWSKEEWQKEAELAFSEGAGSTGKVTAKGKKAAKVWMQAHEFFARHQGMPVWQYMAETYGDLPKVVESARDIPGTAMKQELQEVLKRSGMEPPKVGGPEDARIQQRIGELKPAFEPVVPGEKLPKNATNPQKDMAKAQREMPPGAESYTPKSGPNRGETVQVAPTNKRERGTDLQARIKHTLGNDAEIVSAGQWYKEMNLLWAGVVKGLSDEFVDDILAKMEAKNPSMGGGTRLADPREELAARMGLAFQSTQQNQSVTAGFQQVWKMLDEAYTGRKGVLSDTPTKEGGYGYAQNFYVTERFIALLAEGGATPTKGLGQKLSDFIDSMSNSRTRSLGGEALEPAAIDVWMMRALGYWDDAYLGYLAKANNMSKEQAKKHFNLSDADFIDSPPNEYQYTWALREVNAIKDEFNESNFAGRSNWTANEVQAVLWVETQKAVKYAEAPPSALFVKTGGQVTTTSGQQVFRPTTIKGHDNAELVNPMALRLIPPGNRVDHAKVSAIAEDMRKNGWDYSKMAEDGPIILQYFQNGSTVTIGEGNHRLLAAQEAGLEGVPVVVERYERLPGGPESRPVKGVLPNEDGYVPNNLKASQLFDETDIGMDMSARHPTPAHIMEAYGDEAPDIMRSIDYEETQQLLKIVKAETGVGIMRVIDSTEGIGDGVRIPGSTVVFYGGPKAVAEAGNMLAALKGQRGVRHITTTDSNKSKRGSKWTMDFEFSDTADPATIRPRLEQLAEYLDSRLPEGFNTSLPGLMENDSMALRQLYDGKKVGIDRAEFDKLSELPPDVQAALIDGTWVKEIDEAADPVPLTVNNRVVNVIDADDPVQGMKDAGRADADAVVERHSKAAQDFRDAAYARYADEAFRDRVATERAANPDGGAVYSAQREDGGSGAVRAGYVSGTADAAGGSLYLVRGATDLSTAIHESFHHFTRHLNDSQRREFIKAYNSAHFLVGPRALKGKRTFSREVEEWVAYEFEKWASGEMSTTSPFQSTFKVYAEWALKHGIEPGQQSAQLRSTFERVLTRENATQGATWAADEQRWWEASRVALLKAEDQAHSTAYYRRSRSLMQRSINHPYLGLYPASYMWGKVLPELTRFLLKKPFGLNAPLGGLLLATHAWRNLQLQLQVDEELREFVDEHPDSIRLLTLMVPGTPWELPANAPVVLRRFMAKDAENKLREARGEEPQPFDLGGSINDMVSYSVGYANLAGRVGDMIGEFGPEEDDDEDAETGIPTYMQPQRGNTPLA